MKNNLIVAGPTGTVDPEACFQAVVAFCREVRENMPRFDWGKRSRASALLSLHALSLLLRWRDLSRLSEGQARSLYAVLLIHEFGRSESDAWERATAFFAMPPCEASSAVARVIRHGTPEGVRWAWPADVACENEWLLPLIFLAPRGCAEVERDSFFTRARPQFA